MKLHLVGLAVALLGFGCSKKSDHSEQPAGEGSGSAPAPGRGQRASQQPQPQLPPMTLPEEPKRAEKIALGHALFFDKRLSGGADRSCYSCHMNEDGNGGHDPIAIGSGGKTLTRHAPVIWNVGYWNKALYWDGRAKSLEDNAKGAWAGGNMGAAPGADTPEAIADALDKKAADLAGVPELKKLFEAVSPGGTVRMTDVTSALAEYMRTLVCKDTAYDKFAAGDKTALTDSQQRGLDLFQGRARCGNCHAPPFFSTAMGLENGIYYNVGIGTQVSEDKVDIGRMKVTTKAEHWAAFKPPSLRNVTKSAPYFHDGSVAKLEDAVRLMSSGGIANRNRSTFLYDTKLTADEMTDLLAFLGGLDCPGKLEEPGAPGAAGAAGGPGSGSARAGSAQ